jgi:hypothetical protein
MDDENGNGSPTLLDYFKAGGTTATGILGALNQPKKSATPTGKTDWTLIAGIGAALVGVLILVMVIGKK